MKASEIKDSSANYEDSIYWKALNSLESWLKQNNYSAYDPFDGLSSYLRPLTFGNKLLQQILQQSVRRMPFNIRPIIGIKPHTSTKGMGFLASGYLKLFLFTGETYYKKKAIDCYQWLIQNSSKGYSGYCWGNAFDYVSRASFSNKGEPTIVWSALIGHHFIEAYRVIGDEQYLRIAESVGNFILNDLPRIPARKGICISYVCKNKVAVHNANLLGARLLAELSAILSNNQFLDLAKAAVEYSVASQLEDGSWYYGEEDFFHWIDNWHTAYNLDALLDFQLNTGIETYKTNIIKGLDFYVSHFFRSDGAPKYYWDRDYKYDIQSCSQSIDTLLFYGRIMKRVDLINLAEKVALWTISHMQDKSGYFYLWKNKLFINKTPTFHWGGTTMFHALSHLLLEKKNEY